MCKTTLISSKIYKKHHRFWDISLIKKKYHTSVKNAKCESRKKSAAYDSKGIIAKYDIFAKIFKNNLHDVNF